MNNLYNHSRSRKFLLWLITVLIILALVVGCSPCSACGTYVNQDNSEEYLELKKDGIFYLKEIGVGFTGEWEIEEDVLTLSFPQLGLAIRGKLTGDTIIDEEGKIWVRRKGKQITPTTPAPSPGAIVPEVPTMTPTRVTPTIPPPSPAAVTREVIVPTRIPSPTPDPDQRGLISVHLSDAPDGPAMTRFPPGTTVVYAIFEYADMAGESIKVRVYDNYGSILFEQTQSYTGSGTESMTLPYGRVFPNGRYVTNFYLGEYVARTIIWDVGEPVARSVKPTAAPTATSQQVASTPLHKALAGKWQYGTTWIEFSTDGTMKLGDDVGVASGTYKVIDDDTIQIDVPGKAVHSELVDVVSISENALTLTFSSSDQTIKFGK
ncbi:MAG: hypothetical protein ISS50_07065 [Anaerolineae bacterium]|nr:hypothetical protein [Anaerolineae bacterium]